MRKPLPSVLFLVAALVPAVALAKPPAKAEVPPMPLLTSDPVVLHVAVTGDWKSADRDTLAPSTVGMLLSPDAKGMIVIRRMHAEPRPAKSQADALCDFYAKKITQPPVPSVALDDRHASCDLADKDGERIRVSVVHLGANRDVQLAVLTMSKPDASADTRRDLAKAVESIRVDTGK